MKKNKCIIVVGPESSGSTLVANIFAHVLGMHDFNEWDAAGWCDNGYDMLCHRSLPYGRYPPRFPNIDRWISKYKDDYDLSFILTTRDITISEVSRFYRWGKPFEQSKEESDKARELMVKIMNSGQKYFIWSYETFMFLQKDYLDLLYRFLDIETDFMPDLKDGNVSKIIKLTDSEKRSIKLKHSMNLIEQLRAIKNKFHKRKDPDS